MLCKQNIAPYLVYLRNALPESWNTFLAKYGDDELIDCQGDSDGHVTISALILNEYDWSWLSRADKTGLAGLPETIRLMSYDPEIRVSGMVEELPFTENTFLYPYNCHNGKHYPLFMLDSATEDDDVETPHAHYRLVYVYVCMGGLDYGEDMEPVCKWTTEPFDMNGISFNGSARRDLLLEALEQYERERRARCPGTLYMSRLAAILADKAREKLETDGPAKAIPYFERAADVYLKTYNDHTEIDIGALSVVKQLCGLYYQTCQLEKFHGMWQTGAQAAGEIAAADCDYAKVLNYFDEKEKRRLLELPESPGCTTKE